MRRFRLTRAAQDDLADIDDFTVATWGTEQADRYAAALFDAFGRAVDMPTAGTDRSAFHPGMRSIRAGRHLVFYMEVDGEVVILRIVHERRNLRALVYAEVRAY